MTGAERIVAARLAGRRFRYLEIVVDRDTSSLQKVCNLGEVWVEPSDAIDTLDFRFCAGAWVIVHAEYDRGLRTLNRLSEFAPAKVSLITPKVLIEYTAQETTECAL